jgi:alpha-beta hydrolase superfamily lysophospholipase
VAKLDVAARRAEFAEPHELVEASDGRTLFLRRWGILGKSPVSVLFFHGITAHSGPYGPMLAEQLSRAGFAVFGMDLRGHGLSDGKRGDYPSAERWEKDLTETIAFVKARSAKLVVLGHSLGVLSAIRLHQLCPAEVNGLVLLSMGRTVRTDVRAPPRFASVLKSLFGVALFRGTPLIDIDPREGMVGLDDPLFNFHYSARFYSVLYGVGALRVARMFRAGTVDSPHGHFAGKLDIPVFVGVGDHDEFFPVESTRAFYDGIDAARKEFFAVPGARHAVFPRDCWGPLVAWLGREF